jgi:hypothetical protein
MDVLVFLVNRLHLSELKSTSHHPGSQGLHHLFYKVVSVNLIFVNTTREIYACSHHTPNLHQVLIRQ